MIDLDADTIIAIHEKQLELYGGLSGIKEPGYVEFLASKPFSAYYGEEQYPGLFLKAAVYMHGIATAHAFFDANKRTASDIAISVANHETDLYALSEWIEQNSV